MKYFIHLIILFVLFSFSSLNHAAPFHPVWNAGALKQAQSYSSKDKIVGTHYFYWYDYPDHHFYDDGAYQDDALQDHFPHPESVSFNSVEWHARELQDIIDAGIDFILPVYWGVVDNYFQPGIVFSIRGLGPLQTAIERREREGLTSPKIGLFYDTSTLLPGIRGENRADKYDLRTDEGKDIFYRTIRDFFYQIHPKHWAAVDGKPLVVLYGSGFAKAHDQSTMDYVNQHFQQDFGVRPYMVRDSSWNFKSDAVTSWGAALGKPNIFDYAAQIGPGYNDSAVPGRSTPIRDREDGNFYRWSWNQVLRSSAKMVLIETWNEMHEGTDICESIEFGRQYIDLTREYVDMFKKGMQPDEEIQLEHPDPLPRPASVEGMEYKEADEVGAVLGGQGASKGIWLIRGVEDGQVRNAVVAETSCVKTVEASNTYMYFNIADPYYFDLHQPLEITFSYWDDGFSTLVLQYDSHDTRATLSGAYKDATPLKCGQSRSWKNYQTRIEDARFVNRQNGGSDLRIAVQGGSLAVKEISVKKIR